MSTSSTTLRRMRLRHAALIVIVLVGLIAALPSRSTRAQDGPVQLYASDLSGDYAIQWINLLYERVQIEGVQAPHAARLYGYAGVTLYESVIPFNSGFVSLAGQLHELSDPPWIDEDQIYDPLTVLASAANLMWPAMFEKGTPETMEAFAALYDTQLTERSTEFDADVMERSVAYGEAVAQHLIEWKERDGYTEAQAMAEDYELPAGDPALYVLTTEGTRPIGPFWGNVRTFVLEYADQCAIPMGYTYSEDPDSAFYAQAVEVQEIGRRLTDEQKEIARFWVDTPGQTGTPAGHWIQVVEVLANQFNWGLDRVVMTYGMVGIAVADAFFSAWSLKYQVLLVRPETYIQAHIQRSWAPYIQTPPFPEYPSGHSVVSGSASEVLTQMYGVVAFTTSTNREGEYMERSFTSFKAAAYEAAISRIYGGIHYRAAVENGLEQGECVGKTIMDYVQMQPLSQGGE